MPKMTAASRQASLVRQILVIVGYYYLKKDILLFKCWKVVTDVRSSLRPLSFSQIKQ